jgi:hypothetical protein
MRTGYSLDKFFETGLKSEIQDVLITKDKLNRYSLFGKYHITPADSGQHKITGEMITESIEFVQLKNAVVWCILHNAKKYRDAARIVDLDLKLCSIEFDLVVHRNILKRSAESNARLTYMIKIQEDVYKRRLIIDEITSHLNNSKNIQANKFDHFKKSRV